MSKVMLVMDKPKSCMFCPLLDGETGECKKGGIIEDNENPTKCPLKPLPHKNKYDVEKYATVDYENNVTLGHYLNKGYNYCIDEILGE